MQAQRTILGTFQTVAVCPECHGGGKKASQKCRQCKGEGRIKDIEKIKIKIPAGIDQSESIRLTHKGEAGQAGAEAGDLYIIFRVRPDSLFKREGYDIYTEQEINFSQAALGTKIEVNTLDGPVKLKIPDGMQSGKVFRLKGKGVLKLRASGRGDQFVTILVVTPTRLSHQEKKLFEELAELNSENIDLF
jgi:molecular chaperone DnaJ